MIIESAIPTNGSQT